MYTIKKATAGVTNISLISLISGLILCFLFPSCFLKFFVLCLEDSAAATIVPISPEVKLAVVIVSPAFEIRGLKIK